jgi:hypothetical protein
MSPRHSTDEELIAWLDGELSRLAASSVDRHLQGCWQCRARMKELEDQALHIAKAVSHDTFPGPDRVALAIHRFSALRAQKRHAEFLRSFAPASSGSWFGRYRRFVYGAALAGALALGLTGIMAIRFRLPDAHPVPTQTVTLAVERAEQAWINQPCHQTLRVEMTTAASRDPVRSHLELWSDQPSRRFAVEWRDDTGHLRAAHWMPGPQRSYVFDAKSGTASTGSPAPDEERSSLIFIRGIELTGSSQDLRQLEEQLVRYVKSRSLRPVSLSGTFAEFTGSDGLAVAVEKTQTRGGTIQLRASRESHGMTADLILEVDTGGLEAKSLLLRLHDARHSLQARFVVEKFEKLRRGQLTPASFEPKLGRPAVAPHLPPAAADSEVQVAANQDFSEKEIDIHYALHRIRACMGDPIRVENLEPGKIVVRGLVESDAQKEKILSALGNFGRVEAEIRTVAEALREHPVATVRVLPTEPVALQIGNAMFPMRETLHSYFSGLTDSRDRARAIAELSNQVISLSGSALAEAWAIHRLRQTFPLGHPDPLGLIEQMLADHAAAFRGRVSELRTLLQPLLPPSPAVSPLASADPLTAARSLDDLIRSLFSSSQASEASLDSDLRRLTDLLATTAHIDFTEREP